MAEQPPSFQFEDVPLDQARRMGRGPRMEPMLYDTLRQKIQSLSTDATRIHLGPEITPTRMRTYGRERALRPNTLYLIEGKDIIAQLWAFAVSNLLHNNFPEPPEPALVPRSRVTRGDYAGNVPGELPGQS